MKHISPQRILELGLEADLEPTAEETEHLEACATCAREVELERRLTANLVELPQAEAPPSFVAQTTARYEQAVSKRRLRRTAWGMVITLALGNVAAFAIVGLLVLNGGAVAHGVGTFAQHLVTLGHAFVVVGSKIPLIPVLLMGAVSATVLVLSTGLGRLALRGAEAHS